MRKQRVVLSLILIWPVIAALVSLHFAVNYLVSGLIFLAAPAVIISWFQRDIVVKDGIFALLLSVPFTFIIEYLSHGTGAYQVESMFGLTVFELITVDSFIWAFFAAYLPVAFFEFAIEDHRNKEVFPDRMRYFAALSVLVVAVALIALPRLPTTLNIPYYYLIQGVVLFVVPIAAAFHEYPSEIRKILEAGAYFFYFAIIYELTALQLDIWQFPGTHTNYIGWITLFNHSFPIEEFVFWIALTGMTVISFYDLWDDYAYTGST